MGSRQCGSRSTFQSDRRPFILLDTHTKVGLYRFLRNEVSSAGERWGRERWSRSGGEGRAMCVREVVLVEERGEKGERGERNPMKGELGRQKNGGDGTANDADTNTNSPLPWQHNTTLPTTTVFKARGQ